MAVGATAAAARTLAETVLGKPNGLLGWASVDVAATSAVFVNGLPVGARTQTTWPGRILPAGDLTMAGRDQEWRDLLSGSPVIRPVELWIRLGHDPATFKEGNRAVIEQGMIFMGYTKQAVHHLQICTDRFVWVRGPWESDALWADLSDDPILAAVMESYVESVVARLVH